MQGVVEVAGGRVRGEERDGAWVFQGIPYARGPEGALRWRPPLPPVPWSGIRDATAPGAIAPQTPPLPGLAIPGDPSEQREDCLELSVWTPALDGGRRPVMVWVHGGGFTTGAGSSLLYAGEHLARRGDVVVVTFNYRLGALGWLAHPALASGRSAPFGNWGLLDQVAALQWVHEHIAAFGGDPGQVTVFGESAGGMSIAALLTMPAARGLFQRAIVQSGPPYTHDLAHATTAAQNLVKELGLSEVRREMLESVPAADLVAATAALQRQAPRPGELPLPFLPAVDGVSLPAPPSDAVAAGRAADVPLLVGTTRDELGFFVLADPQQAQLDDEGLLRQVGLAVPGRTPAAVVESYRSARAARAEAVTPRDLWMAAGTDIVFRWPSLQLAASHRVHQERTFVYLFTWETPAFGGILGSCHGLEVPFVFGTVEYPPIGQFAGTGPQAVELSGAMQDAWLAFARTADPSTEGGGRWPAWEPAQRATMVFGVPSRVELAPRDEELVVWGPLETALSRRDGARGAEELVGQGEADAAHA